MAALGGLAVSYERGNPEWSSGGIPGETTRGRNHRTSSSSLVLSSLELSDTNVYEP